MPAPQAQHTLLVKRVVGGAPGLAQVWFQADVLDKYRGASAYKIIRTDTVGRLRGPEWTLDFGIAGGDSLLHLSAKDASERIPAAERDHWAHHAVALPASANFLTMQLTRGACIDDGDVRRW
jgi:hypothetical protein